MLDPATTAIITGAAGNIVAYMLNGPIDALRTWITGIFRHATDDQRSRALRILDEDIVALRQRLSSTDEIRARWSALLASSLATHPDALRGIDAIASAPAPTKRVNIGSQHNYGSGTFVGGDNYGNIN